MEKWDSMNPNGRGRVLWIGASILGAVVVALGVLGGHTYWEQRKAVRERARELMHVHAEHARSKIINWNRANRAGLSEIERWMAESRPNAPGAAIGTGPLAALEEIMARHEFSAVQIETAGRPITVGTGPAGGHRRSPAHIGKSRSPVCILWRDGGGTYWCTYVFTAADSEGKRKEMRVHIDPRQNVFRFLCGFGPNMEWGRFALAQRREGSVDVFWDFGLIRDPPRWESMSEHEGGPYLLALIQSSQMGEGSSPWGERGFPAAKYIPDIGWGIVAWVGESRIYRDLHIAAFAYAGGLVVLAIFGASVLFFFLYGNYLALLRRSEGALSALAGRLLVGREEERLSLSHELHDELAQAIDGALLHLASARRDWLEGKKEKGRRNAAQAMGALDAASRECRRLIRGLRPEVVEKAGFCGAVRALARSRAPLEVTLRIDDEACLDAMPERMRIVLYRILQEALQNVSRHSGAREAGVRLCCEGGKAILEVEDRGRGFRPASVDGTAHFGLTGIRERAILCGGMLRVESSPGAGTRIVAEVPCG